jgi:hypothetical protein
LTRTEHSQLTEIFRRIYHGLLSQGEDVEDLANAVAELKRMLDAAAQQHTLEDEVNSSLERIAKGAADDHNKRSI